MIRCSHRNSTSQVEIWEGCKFSPLLTELLWRAGTKPQQLLQRGYITGLNCESKDKKTHCLWCPFAQSWFSTGGKRAAFVLAILCQTHTGNSCVSPQCMNCPSNRKREWTDHSGFFWVISHHVHFWNLSNLDDGTCAWLSDHLLPFWTKKPLFSNISLLSKVILLPEISSMFFAA